MRALALLGLFACASCRVEVGAPGQAARGEAALVRVYSSMYKQVIDEVQPVLARALAARDAGEVKVEWFQSGSEKVAARLDAELAAGASPCDILLTSDPSTYARLKRDGQLVPYVSPRALRQARAFVDPDGAWATARLSVMVIALSPRLAEERWPLAFGDLQRPDLRVALGDPLASGTNLTTVGALAGRYGWGYFAALKKAGAVVAGGNAAVLQRVESGESDAGVVLIENVLAARARGSKVRLVLPRDGAVVIPGPIALLRHAQRSEAARAVYDALLSEEVQRVMVMSGLLHSPDPALPPPPGAPSLADLLAAQLPPGAGAAESVKSNFNKVFFR